MPLPVAFFAKGVLSDVVSVQYGTVTITQPATSATATITSVDTTQSIVIPIGVTNDDNLNGSLIGELMVDVVLTNGTTVTGRRGGGASYSSVISFMVITFSGVKSLQQVTISGVDSTTSNTLTITSVNTAKALVFIRSPWPQNADVPSFPTTIATIAYRATLTDSTTLTQTRNASAVNRGNTSVTVVEFF